MAFTKKGPYRDVICHKHGILSLSNNFSKKGDSNGQDEDF